MRRRSPSARAQRRTLGLGLGQRLGLGLGLSLGAGLALCGCGDDAADGPQAAAVEAGEWLPGGETTNTLLLGSNAFIRPAENIGLEHEPLFFAGNSFFNQPWVAAPASTGHRDGLGPLFNARACSACHFKDGRGAPPLEPPLAPSGDFIGLLLRVGPPRRDARGAPLPDATYGDQIQPFALPDVPAEGRPRVTYETVPGTYDDGTPYTLLKPTYTLEAPGYGPLDAESVLAPRVAPAMIGLGLLEAIPQARLEALADPEDADGDGVRGRLNRVWDAERGEHTVGRFGWKAEQPSVRQQVAAAFLGDLGLSTPVFAHQGCTAAQPACAGQPTGGTDAAGEPDDTAPEVPEDTLTRVVVYSSLLAVPALTEHDDPAVLRGKGVFARLGCAACHVPSHRTGAHPLPEVAEQTIWPYTDLLLHDLGPGLSDGRPAFEAEGADWRTPPLWGLGRVPAVNHHDRLLHDGRARGVAEAVLWHGGEAEPARAAFAAASAEERAALVRFVESL